MMTYKGLNRRLFVGLVAILGVACGGGDGGVGGTTPDATATDEVAGTPTSEPTGDGTEAMEAIPIRVSTLNFPSLVASIPPIIQDQGFDTKHGLDLTVEPFADIGAFYAAQTNGSVDAGVGGVSVYAGLVEEGADMQIVSSYVGLEPLLLITGDPDIRSVEDLEGRSVAATVASAEYQILAIYARSKGLDLEQDVTLVNGSPADVRSQLEAGRVDAGMLWEPGAALALSDNPDYTVILNGHEAWQELTGERGWELVWAMQRSYIEENPEAVDRFIDALKEAVEWLFDNPEEAAGLMEEASGMPADQFVEVLDQGRVDYDVRPAWEAGVKSSLMTHFQEAVDAGFLDSMPADDIVYEPSS